MSQPSTRASDFHDAHLAGPTRWILLAMLTGFVGLGVVAHHVRHGTALDHAVLGWMVEHRGDGLTTAAVVITNAGSPVAMAALAALAGAMLWWRRSARTAIVVVATLACAAGVSTLTKTLVGAQRPPLVTQLLLEVDHSYPSGHVTGTLALVGIVAVVVGRGRSRAIAFGLGVGVASITLVVALTRLYLGVHWLSDVLGGTLLGGVAILVGSVALESESVATSRATGSAESVTPGVTRVA
ncbi:phosphatase PAP2 family protein [Mycobacterium antarcticum]|uniref:phosphatase PAP2 family protein n=1 Tax=Mycolicibacterium sp. TUM20985 TaxID=3023370 RepID=UPI00257393D9|nr:phosphatase PAP2 family protein [Mycolicibacterium sp. TUM20985]